MKVFIPAQKDANPFFDEIMFHANTEYVFGGLNDYNKQFKTVLVHWPEQLFNWQEPTLEQLSKLKDTIKIWKKNASLVYVVHNLERHSGMTPNFRELYNIIEAECDCMVHMGAFSKAYFLDKFPKKNHRIIYHPLYENSYKVYSKEEARQTLGIKENAMVIIAPGNIRNRKERLFILDAFKKLKHPNKVLVVPRMYQLKWDINFKGSRYLKKVFNFFVNEAKFFSSKYMVSNNFLNARDLSLLMSSSDIVLIPRLKILNSGNVFLGLTFRKFIVGPAIGNVKEVLEMFKMPVFTPKENKTVVNALEESLDTYASYTFDNKTLDKFKAKQVSKQWDALFLELSKA